MRAQVCQKSDSRRDLINGFNEFRALSRLTHPNVLKEVFDSGAHNGLPYFTMELLKGRTLKELVKEWQTLPLTQAI